MKLNTHRDWEELAAALNVSSQEFFRVAPFDYTTLIKNWIHHPIHKPTKFDLKILLENVLESAIESENFYKWLKTLTVLAKNPNRIKREISFEVGSVKPNRSASIEATYMAFKRVQKARAALMGEISKST